MLAESFKTAAELGLREKNKAVLITVMRMFERGEIKQDQFGMAYIHCGARACILGHCQMISDDVRWCTFDGSRDLWKGLFMFGDERRHKHYDVQDAAIAIRSYLTTGKAYWPD